MTDFIIIGRGTPTATIVSLAQVIAVQTKERGTLWMLRGNVQLTAVDISIDQALQVLNGR